ncbi:MAG TPA: hypothetical protein VIM19_07620 [Actinomycetes bacterium]
MSTTTAGLVAAVTVGVGVGFGVGVGAAVRVGDGTVLGLAGDGVGSGVGWTAVVDARGIGTGEWLAAALSEASGRTQPTMPTVMAIRAAPPTTAGNT